MIRVSCSWLHALLYITRHNDPPGLVWTHPEVGRWDEGRNKQIGCGRLEACSWRAWSGMSSSRASLQSHTANLLVAPRHPAFQANSRPSKTGLAVQAKGPCGVRSAAPSDHGPGPGDDRSPVLRSSSPGSVRPPVICPLPCKPALACSVLEVSKQCGSIIRFCSRS